MPELLLELFSEEIPARMQLRAARDLCSLITGGLQDFGLSHREARCHVTPRRLALSLTGLDVRAPAIVEDRKGPRINAPQRAIDGFLNSAGITLEDCEVIEDRKGAYYLARLKRPGQVTADILATLVPETVRKFPWPKSMRWGAGDLRWVRPLLSVLCVFDGKTVPFSLGPLTSGATTRGHRFMADDNMEARDFDQYRSALRRACVIVDESERAHLIDTAAGELAEAAGLEVIRDDGLVKENAGLTEWPVVLMGMFDERFLDLPAEVIIITLKTHQKCLAIRDGAGNLANRYMLIANLAASDGGKKIVEGNNRVITARLSDAAFFWDQDRKSTLEDKVAQLAGITFHAKLGNQAERVARLETLAGELAATTGADASKARLAARLCKADLVTGMVGEFPALQGLMGRYYALGDGVDQQVADAIGDHYKPQGPSDMAPATPVGRTVALADKLDMLAGFWAIDEKPTGSRDPYALRRAALGVIRITLEAGPRIKLLALLTGLIRSSPGFDQTQDAAAVAVNLLHFFADRLKVHLREHGVRHDLIDAVFALSGQDDLVLIVKRVAALSAFLDTGDGQNLLAGAKRAANILRIEEKKDGVRYNGVPDAVLLSEDGEHELAAAIVTAGEAAQKSIAAEDFQAAMAAMAALRAPVDRFFDQVTVNHHDPAVRKNRLIMLSGIRAATSTVADFARIEG